MGHNQKHKRDQRRQIVILGILIFVLIAGGVTVQRWFEERNHRRVEILSPAGAMRAVFSLEVADTPAEQSKGLMFRRSLAADGGMLFIYQEDESHSFWMKNTVISLDIIFIDSEKNVVGILPSVPILNEEPRTVATPSRFVIEFAAGTAERYGISVGDKVVF